MSSPKFNAVDTIRAIRDRQAKLLSRKSAAERVAFFRKAGVAAIAEARTGPHRRRSRAS